MKTKLLLALSLMLSVLCTSCSFTENITINEDGSGRVSFDMDGSQLMAMAGEEMAKSGEKRIDSTFSFKELLATKKDSIAKLSKEEQDRLKKLEPFSIKMLMDAKEQQMNFSIFTDFKKATELQDMMQAMNNFGSTQKQAKAADMGMLQNNSSVTYSYDGKKFKKNVALLPKKKEITEESDENMEMYKAMFESSTYAVNYKFPKRIKSVNHKNAVISDDRRTVTINYSFLDYIEKPETMAIEVDFE